MKSKFFENFRKILIFFEKNRKKLIQKIKLSENSKNEVNFLNFRAPKARERKMLTKIHQNDHFLCDFSTYKHQIGDFKTSKISACGGLQFATKKYPDFGMPKSTFFENRELDPPLTIRPPPSLRSDRGEGGSNCWKLE